MVLRSKTHEDRQTKERQLQMMMLCIIKVGVLKAERPSGYGDACFHLSLHWQVRLKLSHSHTSSVGLRYWDVLAAARTGLTMPG